ncbi:MAG TPA: PEP-CTERM sorting domain-containing protein [Edaphobacter sp.]|nr:PEP-CTERM sorting domain-containing protein [Edaphobacter sp.]
MQKSSLVVTAALLAFTLAAHAETIFSTGFERPTYKVGGLAGQNGATGNLGKVENTKAASGSQAVQFSALGQSGFGDVDQIFFPTFTPTAGDDTVTVQIEALFTQSSTQGTTFEVLDGFSGDLFLDQLTYMDGTVTIGGADSNVGAVAVTPNTWNTYDLTFDYTTQTATGFVDGTLIGSEPFANVATDLTEADFGINSFPGRGKSKDTDSGYFDNLSVTTSPVSPAPEPSGIVLLGTGLLGAAGMLRKRFA